MHIRLRYCGLQSQHGGIDYRLLTTQDVRVFLDPLCGKENLGSGVMFALGIREGQVGVVAINQAGGLQLYASARSITPIVWIPWSLLM